MGNPVYEKLCERLNRFESKVPPVESFYQLLEEIYSQEEAGLAAVFPEGSFALDQLSRELNTDSLKLDCLLEQMADKGQLCASAAETASPSVLRKVLPWSGCPRKSRKSANAKSAWDFKVNRES